MAGRARRTKQRVSKKHPRRKKKPEPVRRSFAFVPFAVLGVLLALGIAFAADEMETSALQARLFSEYGARVSFETQPGANRGMFFPKTGPYNERLGYSYIPFYIKNLAAEDFSVTAQARASAGYGKLVRKGLYPIYRPKTAAGLTLFDSASGKIYDASYPNHVYEKFDDIPPLLVDTLLFIENRELMESSLPTHNPVIEWDRLFAAVLGRLAGPFRAGGNSGGGSTLATQIEKFRFSPEGKTGSAAEKLKQIVSASLRVYLDGPDTREARKKIVLDYLNNTPLLARPGFGEINSIGDALWAWFGLDLKEASAAMNADERSSAGLGAKAFAYRSTLGLILAQRRPSYYLQANRKALDELIDASLDRLCGARVISGELRDAAKAARLNFLQAAPALPEPAYIEQKAVNAFRAHLMSLLGLKKLYELDRLDLAGKTTLDSGAQQKLVEFLKKMGDKDFLKANGLYGHRLLSSGNDPSKIKWSVVLYERGDAGNLLRLQADNVSAPFDMNEGMKLDLGSTAKLRTLVTYLEIISELHRRYAGLDPEDLQDLGEDVPDVLSGWILEHLEAHPKATLEETLRASLERRYSASPAEVFFTGGGEHTFHNFEREEDSRVMDLREAFRHSVNLVFVRLMRDIVNYTVAQEPRTKDELLYDDENPARRDYLERFADQEGRVFLGRYISELEKLSQAERLGRIVSHAHKGATARTALFRSLFPQAGFEDYAAFMKERMAPAVVAEQRLRKLFDSHAPGKYSLADRAYLAGVNPMELWLLTYWSSKPGATYRELMQASKDVRIDSYAWLYNSGPHAQNTRIRIILEEDAFAHIHKRWKRLGYPFDRLVPSLATSIGSSADRPGALAELAGIILNDGKKLPVQRFEGLEFGTGTPYETHLVFDGDRAPQQVLSPDVARVMKAVMAEVVSNGTAQRLKDVYKDLQGKVIPVGGKTGTGDHRYDEFGAGGQLISSRVVNRTGTFVFYIGDRFFGTITAHVAGEDAGDYMFTSALSAQMLKALAPILNPLINNGATQRSSRDAPAKGPPADEALVSDKDEDVSFNRQGDSAVGDAPVIETEETQQ
ncbi:MAG: transglycosylase domain-containing protein [Alphaproteobacteria bacterium]|nr:transglycosylase domain-containing protein [Alphaproteobacteria bacterium]